MPAARSAGAETATAAKPAIATSLARLPRESGIQAVPMATTAMPSDVTAIDSVSRGRPSRRTSWWPNITANPTTRATGTRRR